MGIAALVASLEDPRCRVASLRLSQNGIGHRGGDHLGHMLTGGRRGDEWGKVSTEKNGCGATVVHFLDETSAAEWSICEEADDRHIAIENRV